VAGAGTCNFTVRTPFTASVARVLDETALGDSRSAIVACF
jgi:hypothetical protein